MTGRGSSLTTTRRDVILWVAGSGLESYRPPGNDVSPTFSPDGKTIAFISARKGEQQIWLMNGSDVHQQHQLTRDATAKGDRVDWSPDGKYLTYEAGDDIWLVGADGSKPTNLTQTGTVEFGPSWSPDSQEIAFVRIDGAKKLVYVMNVDGSHPHAVGGGGRQLVPSWQAVR
jgi:TolB protein